MNVVIRYFTGTGNTAQACAIAADAFRGAGWKIDIQEISIPVAGRDEAAEHADLLLAAFPVLGFAPPRTIVRWMKRLSKRDGQRAAVLAVGGATFVKGRYIPGWGADAPFAAARALRRKGRRIVGLFETSLPENFTQATNPPTDAHCAEIRQRNEPDIRSFAERLAVAAASGADGPLMARGLFARVPLMPVGFLFAHFGRPILARTFIADGSCNACGLCARACPAGAIRMAGGRPAWSAQCVECNRCINICPQKSIRTSALALALQLAFALCSTAAAISLPLPVSAPLAFRALVRTALLLGFFLLQLGPFSFLIGRLSRPPKQSRAFEVSFNGGYRRYTAEGFKPWIRAADKGLTS